MSCDLLIIGGRGDLAYRKLYPALYHLDQGGHLPTPFGIFGVARSSEPTPDFAHAIQSGVKLAIGREVNHADWQQFARRLQYCRADAAAPADMVALREKHFPNTRRQLIVYLATPPGLFSSICQTLKQAGLARSSTRVIVEKPLGNDLASFLAINKALTAVFDERQIFRIDHYLGKESVQNLMALRFANTFLEPLWNHKYIDHVQITAAESIGVTGRWKSYNAVGALRDMVQNHLLQLLCLIAMEPPSKLTADNVRDEKLKVLRGVTHTPCDEIGKYTIRGQYQTGVVSGQQVPGYVEEEDSQGATDVETFVALKTGINNWRWAGVPFYMRTGKRMPERNLEIIVQFKKLHHAIFPGNSIATANHPNALRVCLQPHDNIELHMMTRVPGLTRDMALQESVLDLSFTGRTAQGRIVDSYERLLLDVIRGDKTLFMRADELEAAWTWIDTIRAGWQETKQPALPYAAGSWGPDEAELLLHKEHRHWYRAHAS